MFNFATMHFFSLKSSTGKGFGSSSRLLFARVEPERPSPPQSKDQVKRPENLMVRVFAAFPGPSRGLGPVRTEPHVLHTCAAQVEPTPSRPSRSPHAQKGGGLVKLSLKRLLFFLG